MLINSVSKFTNLSTQLPIYHVADGHMIQYRNTWSIDFLDFFYLKEWNANCVKGISALDFKTF